jgi:D-psicose/D-tagatose/L-ribulose 3-epimerase
LGNLEDEMKFGTYFAYWEQEWKADYTFYVKKVARLGFDVLEISAANFSDMNRQDLEDLKICAEDNNILLSSCIGLPIEYNRLV